MRYVYVQDVNGTPLMPTKRFGKVRRMLKSGEAKVVNRLPFTIRLTRETKTHVLQPVIVGQDPGRTNIGVAAVRSDGTELYRAHVETRNKDIVTLMNDRRAARSASRRGERLRRKRRAKKHGTMSKTLDNGRKLPGCQEVLAVKDIINTEARFNNRLRPEGWLTPTATQLLRTHLRVIQEVAKILPVTDVVVEVNKFAFMQLDNPDMRKCDIDFRRGPLYGTSGVEAAVSMMQDDKCILCRKHAIEHFHHIVPKSKRGSNTVDNIAGLCLACHDKVHKDKDTHDKMAKLKAGLTKKYGGASVLNQIIPSLVKEVSVHYPEHSHVTNGWNTKKFRDDHGIEKTHDVDAYCIAASILGEVDFSISTEPYEIKQFRRHNRAIIHSQRERTYHCDERIAAKNRKKRTNQTYDALEDWFNTMVEKHGVKKAEQMRSGLRVQKSKRRYNTPNRIMPGTVFMYQGKRYVLAGQQNKGAYYKPLGQKGIRIPAKDVKIIQQNSGLVYVG